MTQAAAAAITAYESARRRFAQEALDLRRSGRPLAAGKARYTARLLHRAALAEELNPEPIGIGRLA